MAKIAGSNAFFVVHLHTIKIVIIQFQTYCGKNEELWHPLQKTPQKFKTGIYFLSSIVFSSLK